MLFKDLVSLPVRNSETRTEEWRSHDQEREKHGQWGFSHVRAHVRDRGALRLLEKSRESRHENNTEHGAHAQRGGWRQEAKDAAFRRMGGAWVDRWPQSLQEESGSADTQPSLAPKAVLLLTFDSYNCTIIISFVCAWCVCTCAHACSHVSVSSTFKRQIHWPGAFHAV